MALTDKLTSIANGFRSSRGLTDKLSLDQMASLAAESSLSKGIAEFTNMNDVVTSYLAAADAAYTDSNSASKTVMESYYTPTGNKDRPLGKSITSSTSSSFYLQNEDDGDGWKQSVNSSSYTIYNAIPNDVSQYLVKKSDGTLVSNGRIKPTGKVRMLYFDYAARNSRDIGGWACDGGTVKYGRLFRGANVGGSITNEDIKRAQDIGIKMEVDIRNESTQTTSLFGSNVRYVNLPLSLYYADIVNLSGAEVETAKTILRTLMESAIYETPTYFHCSVGRDRAGTIAFMLLALLGVSRADIDKDYELSSFTPEDKLTLRTRTDYCGLGTYLATFGGSKLRDHAVRWFLKAGFTFDEMNAFRAAMIDGAPETLVAANYGYTVTTSLSNCTISGSAQSVPYGGTYTATITPNKGYKISSIVVKMGTTVVYSGTSASISVSNVTDNITVTASCVVAYKNWLPLAIATDGSVYNSKGWKDSTRLSSSGGDSSASGMSTSGYIPCKAGDVIRLQGINHKPAGSTNYRLIFYTSSFALNSDALIQGGYSSAYTEIGAVTDSSGNLTKFNVASYKKSNGTAVDVSNVAYFRICGDTFASDAIITINEEIV